MGAASWCVVAVRRARARTLARMFQSPGQCPQCERADLVRKGGKDQCPVCFYLQPCCDGGDLCGPGWTDTRATG